MKNKGVAVAIVTLKHASKMSPQLRHELAKWLRRQGTALENHHKELSPKFTAKYFLS